MRGCAGEHGELAMLHDPDFHASCCAVEQADGVLESMVSAGRPVLHNPDFHASCCAVEQAVGVLESMVSGGAASAALLPCMHPAVLSNKRLACLRA